MVVWVVIELMIFYFNLYVCVTRNSLVMKNLNAPCMEYMSLFAESLKNKQVIYIFLLAQLIICMKYSKQGDDGRSAI